MDPIVVEFYVKAFIFFTILFLTGRQLFNFVLRGFAPFFPSRPWVAAQVLEEIKRLPLKKDFNMVSIGSGRSGVSHAVEKFFPDARMVGIEDTWLSFTVSYLQCYLQGTDIMVKKNDELHRINVADKDLIYLKLDPEKLRELDKKLKFECKTGCLIISNGFVIPGFKPIRTVTLDDKKGRFAWLGQNRSLTTKKGSKHKKENKVYIYEIE